MPKLCVFCRNNSEPPENFLSHNVKDPWTGKTTCPVLRKYRCIVRSFFDILLFFDNLFNFYFK